MCDCSAFDPYPLLRHVFDEHVRRFGDPDSVYHFGQATAHGVRIFDRLDVYAWQPSNSVPVTTFATLGLSERTMDGCTHRAELHWTIRGGLTSDGEADAAAFLANLATYPLLRKTFLDFWHLIPRTGPIPCFPSCSAALFHPSFVESGWDRFEFAGTDIRLLNVVPLTPLECEEAQVRGVNVLMARLYADGTDLFSGRSERERQRRLADDLRAT